MAGVDPSSREAADARLSLAARVSRALITFSHSVEIRAHEKHSIGRADKLSRFLRLPLMTYGFEGT